jgi:hypothetical protein
MKILCYLNRRCGLMESVFWDDNEGIGFRSANVKRPRDIYAPSSKA